MFGSSPFRTPWTTSLLVLLVIWSVWLLGMPAETRSSSLSLPAPVKSALDAIPKMPAARPSTEVTDHKESNAKGANSRAPLASTKTSESITEAYEAEKTFSATKAGAPGPAKIAEAAESPKEASEFSSTSKTLVLYAYAESPSARENIEFFVEHGLHGAADFIFILNGDTDAHKLLPNKPNIRFIHRENKCFDLGAYAEVLTGKDLYKNYSRFIMLNASIRGPFVPYWAEICWSDMYLKRVTEETKLVGMTGNCWPQFHVQSMIWATDFTGMSLLLFPPHDPDLSPGEEQPTGINACFDGWNSAVHAEIGSSQVIIKAGYKLDIMMSAYHADRNYVEHCDTTVNGDVLWNGKYQGTNLHPYETIFLKTNRDIDPVMIEKLTGWHNGRNYSSWDYCI